MLRCRIPVAMLLALTLPMQSFAGGRCCQSGHGICCSVSVKQSNDQASSCCSQSRTTAQPGQCKHCAAAENGKANQPSVDRSNCHCKQNPQERPATEQRRPLSLESILIPQDSLFVVVRRSAPSPLKFEFIDRSQGRRLHVLHCVWLI